MPLISLVYTSVTARSLSDDDLKVILDVSRRNNARRSITGMLLFKDGHFIQALEGEEKDVLPLYDTIAADPRHQNIYRMYSRRVTERSFGTWQMGFNKLDSIAAVELPGFTDFLARPFDPSFLHENPSRAAYLLEYFKTRSVF